MTVILHGNQAGSDGRKLCSGHVAARTFLSGSARLKARGLEQRVGRTQVALLSSQQSVKQVASEVSGLTNLI
jgi:hypothetical protein